MVSNLTIGERIKSRRLEIGLSQTDLAMQAEVAKQSLYKYEKNIVTNIPTDVIERLAMALFTSPAYLMGWADEPRSDQEGAQFDEAPMGEKIKWLRKQKGLTQTELGERLGVKMNAVSKWECGRVNDIPMDKIKAMAQIFDVTPAYLMGDETGIAAARAESSMTEAEAAFEHFRELNHEELERIVFQTPVLERLRGLLFFVGFCVWQVDDTHFKLYPTGSTVLGEDPIEIPTLPQDMSYDDLAYVAEDILDQWYSNMRQRDKEIFESDHREFSDTYSKLNVDGRKRAIENLQDLAGNPKYVE